MLFEDEMSKRLLEKEVSPNPFFARKNVFSLDGEWRVTFSKTNQPSQIYSQKIRVPYSVETAASLLSKNLQGKDFFLCYRKEVLSPKEFIGNPALLHFLAVDQVADIYWDGIKIGHHEGGYEPFSVYIPALGRRNILEVIVQDDVTSPRYVHGKQSKNPFMIRYQETSGIYQSVYIERLPNGPYIKELHVLPSYETRSLSLFLEVEGELEQDDVQKVECFFEGRKETGPDLQTHRINKKYQAKFFQEMQCLGIHSHIEMTQDNPHKQNPSYPQRDTGNLYFSQKNTGKNNHCQQ